MKLLEKKNLSILYHGNLPALPYEKIKNAILGPSYVLSVAFVAPAAAVTLNKQYRQKTYIPNTLSFPLTKESGELIICRSIARKEHAAFDLSYQNYLLFLLIHSMLHLKGMAHGSTMEGMEATHMRRFKLKNETTNHRRH